MIKQFDDRESQIKAVNNGKGTLAALMHDDDYTLMN